MGLVGLILACYGGLYGTKRTGTEAQSKTDMGQTFVDGISELVALMSPSDSYIRFKGPTGHK